MLLLLLAADGVDSWLWCLSYNDSLLLISEEVGPGSYMESIWIGWQNSRLLPPMPSKQDGRLSMTCTSDRDRPYRVPQLHFLMLPITLDISLKSNRLSNRWRFNPVSQTQYALCDFLNLCLPFLTLSHPKPPGCTSSNLNSKDLFDVFRVCTKGLITHWLCPGEVIVLFTLYFCIVCKWMMIESLQIPS